MRIDRKILSLAGAVILAGFAVFFQVSRELLIKYLGMDSSYWNDMMDAAIVFRIAASSIGIVVGVWMILIGFIPIYRTK